MISAASPSSQSKEKESQPAVPSMTRNLESDEKDHLGRLLSTVAIHELTTWIPCKKGSGYSFLQNHWKRASESIRRISLEFNSLASDGQELSRESRRFLENLRLICAALNDTRGALRDTGKLPLIRKDSTLSKPRAYAIAEGYLRATHFEFKEDLFLIYLEALQQKLPVRLREIFALKPMLQLVVLEQIAAAADLFSSSFEALEESYSDREAELTKWIDSLREIGETDWKGLYDKVSQIERILKKDPAEAYAIMDFESRQYYGERVAELAAYSGVSKPKMFQELLKNSPRNRTTSAWFADRIAISRTQLSAMSRRGSVTSAATSVGTLPVSLSKYLVRKAGDVTQ